RRVRPRDGAGLRARARVALAPPDRARGGGAAVVGQRGCGRRRARDGGALRPVLARRPPPRARDRACVRLGGGRLLGRRPYPLRPVRLLIGGPPARAPPPRAVSPGRPPRRPRLAAAGGP